MLWACMLCTDQLSCSKFCLFCRLAYAGLGMPPNFLQAGMHAAAFTARARSIHRSLIVLGDACLLEV